MGKKQYRRSLSLEGRLYKRLKNYCDRHGTTVTAVVSRLVEAKMEREFEPVVTERPEPYPKPRPSEAIAADLAARHAANFTF